MGYCTNCGASNASGNSFCWKCGGALAASEAGEAAGNSPGAQPVGGERPRVEPVQPQPQWVYVMHPPRPRRQRKPKAPTNGLSTAGMILGIVSLALYWVPYIAIVTSVIGLIFSIRSRAPRYRFWAGGLTMNIIGLSVSAFALTMTIAACSSRGYYY